MKAQIFDKDNKTVAVSGYFDPLHIGHIEYFRLAKELVGKNGKLIVILNNDEQADLDKRKVFMVLEERRKIIEAIKYVDEVYVSIDNDDTVCKSLTALLPDIFAKGGDRYISKIPETKICKKYGIKLIDGLGKKIQASSALITKWEKKNDK